MSGEPDLWAQAEDKPGHGESSPFANESSTRQVIRLQPENISGLAWPWFLALLLPVNVGLQQTLFRFIQFTGFHLFDQFVKALRFQVAG